MGADSTPHRSSRRRATHAAHPGSRALSASTALLALALAFDTEAARAALAACFEPLLGRAVGAHSFASLSAAAWQGLAHALVTILGPVLTAIVAGVMVVGLAQRAGSPARGAPQGRDARAMPFDIGARVRALLDGARALDGAFALLALLSLSAVAWLTIAPNVAGVLALPSGDAERVAPQLLELLETLAVRLILAGVCLGVVDYLWRRARFAQRMRLTPRELRDEQREQHGDPSLRRERARRMRAGDGQDRGGMK